MRGVPAVSEVLRLLLLGLPNVIVAMVVLVIGRLAARAVSNLVRGETAGEILREWYTKAQEKSGQIARSADAMERRVAERDRRVAENAAAYRQGGQLNPNPSERRHPSEGG